MAELARFLPVFLAADLLLPFALAPFCPGYRHKEQVMSALGSKKSPVRAVYSGWLVLLGLFLLACNPGLYRVLTPGPAWVFLALLDLYAVGAWREPAARPFIFCKRRGPNRRGSRSRGIKKPFPGKLYLKKQHRKAV